MKRFLAILLVAAGLATQLQAADDRDEMVFDRNKGGIYAIYSRALRDNPHLSGKVVFWIDITAKGDVTGCRVHESTLRSPDFENRLCERIRQFKFASRNSAVTITKMIEFFPA
jgi:hypothetical protein